MQHSLSEQAPAILNFADTALLSRRAMAAGSSVLLWGPPGIGKSALAGIIASAADRRLVTLIGSTCESTDFGFPVVDVETRDGEQITKLRRIPLDEIAQCMTPGAILFLDELTGVPPSVQQPMLRLALEKWVGSIHLDDDTWILAAANAPEHAPAAQEISAALGNRFCQIILQPTVDEVCRYMATLGDAGSPLRDAALTWVGVAHAEPAIVQLIPPDESVQRGAPYASSRGVEKGLRLWADCVAAKDPESIQHAALAGWWGERVAGLFLGVQKYQDQLPTEAEFLKDPAGCKCPAEPQYQIAAIGLLTRLAQRDSWASYIYATRLRPEMRMAACRALLGSVKGQPKKSPHMKAGKLAKQKLIVETQRGLAGAL